MGRLVKEDEVVGGRYRITGPLLGEGSFAEARTTPARPRAASPGLTRGAAAVQVYPAEDAETKQQVRLLTRSQQSGCTAAC